MTPRQQKLLQAIIDEFIVTAEAVGSSHLKRKLRLNLSPATIRNEMVDLVKMGYLEKPHSSSGRVPTVMGYKEFINHIMKELEDLDIELETVIKEDLFQNRFDIDDLIYKAINRIAKETENLAFSIVGKRIYYSGLSCMIECPEFSDSVMLKRVLHAVEDQEVLLELLNKYNTIKDVRVLFGDDTGIDYFYDTALVYKLIKLHGNNSGFIGAIGPKRMNYTHNIAVVDFIGESINNMLQTW